MEQKPFENYLKLLKTNIKSGATEEMNNYCNDEIELYDCLYRIYNNNCQT